MLPRRLLAPAPHRPARNRPTLHGRARKGHGLLFAPGTPEDYKPQVREQLAKRFAWVDRQLAGKDYLMGNFSVADAYLYTVSRWGQYLGVNLSGLGNIVAFQKRMEQRSAVQAALRAEGLPA